MSSPYLRQASTEDLAAILALEHTCFDEPDERFNKRQIRRLILSSTAQVLVVEGDKGGLLGWAAGLVRHSHGRASGRIYAIAIAPSARGQQLGRRLAEALLGAMKAAGAGPIYLEVRSDNDSALSLYRHLGFRKLRELPGYYGEGRNGLKLKLDSYETTPMHSVGA